MPEIVLPLQFFRKVVDAKFNASLTPGILRNPDVKAYAADLLATFASADNLHPVSANNEPITTLDALLTDADPVFGTAPSFDHEWERREYIAGLILFHFGIYPEGAARFPLWRSDPVARVRDVALESYYILSRFTVFEYEERARFFSLLANGKNFDHIVEGLNWVSEDLRPLLPPQ